LRPIRAAAFLLVAPLLGLAAGCAGSRPPTAAAPRPAPEAPRGHDLESPVDPDRAEELRRESVEALKETEAILAGLSEETRREHGGEVASVESLVAESRTALAEDEVVRAHNLARKALEIARAL